MILSKILIRTRTRHSIKIIVKGKRIERNDLAGTQTKSMLRFGRLSVAPVLRSVRQKTKRMTKRTKIRKIKKTLGPMTRGTKSILKTIQMKMKIHKMSLRMVENRELLTNSREIRRKSRSRQSLWDITGSSPSNSKKIMRYIARISINLCRRSTWNAQ